MASCNYYSIVFALHCKQHRNDNCRKCHHIYEKHLKLHPLLRLGFDMIIWGKKRSLKTKKCAIARYAVN